MKCNCCLGYVDVPYEGSYFYYSDSLKNDNIFIYEDVRSFYKYNFCPYCGKDLKNIIIKEE